MKSTKKIVCIILAALIAVAAIVTTCVLCLKNCNNSSNPSDGPVMDGGNNSSGGNEGGNGGNEGGNGGNEGGNGSNEGGEKPEQPELNEPAIYGASNVSLPAGKFFDFISGVTAKSSSGADITSLIEVSGTVNTSKAGEYALTYSVTDSFGKTAMAVRKVTVTDNPHLGEVKPVPIFTSETAYNIAEGCASTATFTSNNNSHMAFDGDLTTRWESNHGEDDVALTLDLGAILPVEGILIDWEAAYAVDFEILISTDGKTYSQIAEVKNQTNLERDGEGRLRNKFNLTEETQARFIRLHCTKRVTIFGYSIFEFEVFGTQGTVLPAKQFPVLYNAYEYGSPDWSIPDEQWLLVDLGEVKQFNALELSWSDWQTPVSYEIFLSENGEWENAEKIRLDGQNIVYGANNNATVSARYVKIALHERRFTAQAYLVNQITFKLDGKEFNRESYEITASSSREGHEPVLARGDYGTFWASEYRSDADVLDFKDFSDSNRKDGAFAAKKIDLGAVQDIGRVDLYWNGSDGGKGKYYDLQISTDGTNWETVFRQNHGDNRIQRVYVYETARYVRVIDYQSNSEQSFMLEGIVVNSQFPETVEPRVEYNTNLTFPEQSVVNTENGSYITGGTDFPASRLIAYLDDSLRDKPVPSNDWWQGLLINDKGYNMYMNPLTSVFKADGLWITSPGDGYFSGLVPGNGSQTVNVDEHDVRIGYADMGSNAEVRVTGYSDYGISAVMTDNKNVDKLTAFLSQGALYAYCLFAEPEKATVWADNIVAIYDLSGNEILTALNGEYTGDCIILCVRAHSGYEGGIQKYKDSDGKEQFNAKEYEERYYIVNVPENTKFIRGEKAIKAQMSGGNYMSVGALSSKTVINETQANESTVHGVLNITEAEKMHEHGYAFVVGTRVDYSFNEITNEVTTEFRLTVMSVRSGYSGEAYSAYMPHQLSKSEYSGGYVYDSIRGNCRSFTGNLFTTVDYFNGIVPTFSEPDDDGYSADVLYKQLVMLYENNGGSKAPENSNLISGDPYWQGKNLHPMAMAALAADQIGAPDLRDAFLDKIEYILTDWFTYNPVSDAKTGAYFYYDSEWGTLYYKNSEFGAGVNLADHYFTYGYYTLASGVLCAYRPQFAAKFGDMIELLIRDYMNWRRDDELFPYMRNFDTFAGHGWAGGYADNNGGNNQESAGEALNSWVGAYLYATAVKNEDIRIAAIYGFTTELNAIKHYWFNYFGDFPESYAYGVAGQVYGGSIAYSTFFNGEPIYMYGIHLIPGEEFLTSYGVNSNERERLKALIENLRKEQGMWDVEEAHKEIYAWQHILIPITAIYDADEAIEWYNQTLKKQGGVGNASEQFNVYWLIHGMKSTGVRATEIWAENGASATIYKLGNEYKAVCWNPSSEPVRITFRSANGVVGSALVPACSLVTVNPEKVTESFESFTDSSAVKVEDCSETNNATLNSGAIAFENGGSAKYLLACGTQENYVKIVLKGNLQNAELFIDGVPHALAQTSEGYETQPLVLTFRHEFEIRANGGVLSGIRFETLELKQINISGATATASSNNDNNVAANAVDGNEKTRWESVQGRDGEWIIIKLPQAVTVYQMQIIWEAASAAEYNVYFSLTGEDGDWNKVFHGEYSQGARTDVIAPDAVTQVKYIKIEGVRRTTNYGYSIYELKLFNL